MNILFSFNNNETETWRDTWGAIDEIATCETGYSLINPDELDNNEMYTLKPHDDYFQSKILPFITANYIEKFDLFYIYNTFIVEESESLLRGLFYYNFHRIEKEKVQFIKLYMNCVCVFIHYLHVIRENEVYKLENDLIYLNDKQREKLLDDYLLLYNNPIVEKFKRELKEYSYSKTYVYNFEMFIISEEIYNYLKDSNINNIFESFEKDQESIMKSIIKKIDYYMLNKKSEILMFKKNGRH